MCVSNFLTVSGLFNNCSQYPADIYWKLLLTRIHKLFNKVLNKYRQIRVAIRDLSTSQISKLCTLTWSSSYLKKMVFASQYWPSRRISEMNTFPKLVIITQWTLRTQPPQSQNVKKKLNWQSGLMNYSKIGIFRIFFVVVLLARFSPWSWYWNAFIV